MPYLDAIVEYAYCHNQSAVIPCPRTGTIKNPVVSET